LERVLSDLSQTDNRQSHLVIDGEYLHHLDMAGAETLVQEAKNVRKTVINWRYCCVIIIWMMCCNVVV